MKTLVSVLIGGTLRLEVLKGLTPGDGVQPPDPTDVVYANSTTTYANNTNVYANGSQGN